MSNKVILNGRIGCTCCRSDCSHV